MRGGYQRRRRHSLGQLLWKSRGNPGGGDGSRLTCSMVQGGTYVIGKRGLVDAGM